MIETESIQEDRAQSDQPTKKALVWAHQRGAGHGPLGALGNMQARII